MSTTTTRTELPAGTWQADTLHSSVGFAVKHNLISTFRGSFDSFDARLTVDERGQSDLVGTVAVTSVAITDTTLADHLAAPDFFDAARHPELRFHSSELRRFGKTLESDGELTIKGTTQAVRATGTITEVIDDPFDGSRLAIELEAVIDRRDYGMGWNMTMPRGGLYLANEVTLTITLEFVSVPAD